MKFASLHHHSTFSYLDGFGTPEQHVEAAADLGMSAVAMTEHGNISSHVRHERAANKQGLKPLFGCELYTGGVDEHTRSRWKWHLTVLAQNEVGYQNLLRLVSAGWAEGFFYEPTVSGEMLARYSEGLLVLSGCAGSKLACDLLGGKGVPAHDADYRAALRTARKFRALLGDRFYLEVQAFPELERTRNINQAYERLSAETGIPLVVTGDVHYPRPEDNKMQLILHAVGRGGQNNTVEKQAQGWGYDVRLTMLQDAAVLQRLQASGLSGPAATAALHHSAEIAQRCTVTLPKLEQLRYPTHDAKQLFRTWLNKGWKYRGLHRQPQAVRRQYLARAQYEIELIEAKDFVDYFLVLSDLVRYAKNSGVVVGPARGSAAASLVCYLLRITEIDPVPFPNLLFERFIDLTREDLPDVDLDFDDEERWRVRDYLVRQWGDDRVGNIGTFTRYKGKNSIDDVARVHSVPEYETKQLKELLIERASGDLRGDATIEDTIEMFPQAKEVFDKYPQLYQAQRLEGNLRGFSTHAAGLVVANEPLTNAVAVYTRTDKKTGETSSVLSIDKHDADYLNVLKIDVLGLATMGLIRIALQDIGMKLDDLYRLPLDDADTIQGFRENDVVGIFQFDGRAMRSVNKEVKPDNFLELCDVNALSRPGPLHSGAAAEYIMVKHGKKDALHYPAPAGAIVDAVTKHSQYQIVYQEQILQLVRQLANFSWAESASIRKLISKKQGEQALNSMRQRFLDGTAENGIDDGTALLIWKQIVTAGAYAFCLTGDTVVEKAGRSGEPATITLEDLYNRLQPGVAHWDGPCIVCNQVEEWHLVGDKPRRYYSGRCRTCRAWLNAFRQRGIRLLQMDDDGVVRPARLIGIGDPVLRPVLKMTTASGRTVRMSEEHRVLTAKGYAQAKDLRVGMQIAAMGERPKNRSLAPRNASNPHLARAKTEVIARSGDRCEHCKRLNSGDRHCLEFAHILHLNDLGGDLEKYHAATNILHLCNSCHKKFDYLKGERKVRWSRGRPTFLDAVTEIRSDGHDYVYDVEMEQPNHNYVGNGLVHHNNASHCASYSVVGYWTMWLKRHHPQTFYMAALRKVRPNKEGDVKRGQLLRDAVLKGVEILPPRLHTSGITWQREGTGVRAGLLQVKGVGERAAADLVQARERWKLQSDAPFGIDAAVAMRQKGDAYNTASYKALAAVHDDDDPFQLRVLGESISKVRAAISNGELDLPMPTHTSTDVPYEAKFERVVWLGVIRERNLKDLFELHMSRTGEQLDPATVKDPHLVNWTVMLGEDDTDLLTITVDRWKYPRFKEMVWGLRPGHDVVLIKGIKKRQYRRAIYVNAMWVIDPT